jgi:hypothetical protein
MFICGVLRSLGGALLLILALVLVKTSDALADAAAPRRELAVPAGLSALRPVSNPPRMDSLFIEHAVSNPYISGVSYQIGWNEIEPTEGQFDWSKLDALFAAAEQSNKWVHLLIYSGFHTPSWALEGVKTESFPVQYGPGKGDIEPLPMPWDDVYLDRWFKFLRKVADRYGKSPAFVMIAAAGPTSVSAEMTLPESPADLKIWQSAGYTPKKYIAAYQTVFQTFASIFPDQFISLSLGDGLNINDHGKISKKEKARTRQMVIDQGVDLLGHRFVLQNSDLHAGPDQHPVTAYVMSCSGKMNTGLEERCSAEKGSAAMGAEGDPPLALRKSIDLGMTPNDSGKHVNYIEIYEADVIADEMQPVLKYGASLFHSE